MQILLHSRLIQQKTDQQFLGKNFNFYRYEKSLVSRWAQDLDRDLWARIDLGWHKEEEAKGNYFRNSF